VTDVELRTRRAMTVLADQVAPADLLVRLDRRAAESRPRRAVPRLALVAAVAAVAILVALGVVLRSPSPHVIHPVVHPPKVIRLAGAATAAPGRAVMEVTLAPVRDRGPDTYVLVSGRDEVTRVPVSQHGPKSFSQHLSQDGTRLMVQTDTAAAPTLEILDLRTGRRDHLTGVVGYCPRLSPDHRTVAVWAPSDEPDPLVLVDVATRAVHEVPQASRPQTSTVGGCNTVGWSPDGTRLAMPAGEGARVVDLQGHDVASLPLRYLVNGAQSWSPDGRRILLYVRSEGRFVVHTLATGEETSLGAVRLVMAPVGWAGARVVWLAGSPGDQRLVTTDQHGGDEQLWTRFDVGDRAVQTVSWSGELAGQPL
jgi:Tol biopolymer transport system component